MIDIPAWGWQVVTGAAVGLIVVGLLGAWRMGLNAAKVRSRAAHNSRLMSVTPEARPAQAADATLDPAVVRMIERLREQNRQLANQLRDLKEAAAPRPAPTSAAGPDDHATFDLGERCTSLERQLDALRKAHTQELAQLIRTVLEQIDALQTAHSEQVQVLQAQLGEGGDSLALRNASQAVQQASRTATAAFGRAG